MLATYDRLPLLYSDAEGSGWCAAVACLPCGKLVYTRARAPTSLRRRLKKRKTQIAAFELWAAAVAALTFAMPFGGSSVLFVDNMAAVGCLVRASSKQPDLNVIAGALAAQCSLHAVGLIIRYVLTKLNLADAPSRGRVQELVQAGAEEVEAVCPSWDVGSDAWLDWLVGRV